MARRAGEFTSPLRWRNNSASGSNEAEPTCETIQAGRYLWPRWVRACLAGRSHLIHYNAASEEGKGSGGDHWCCCWMNRKDEERKQEEQEDCYLVRYVKPAKSFRVHATSYKTNFTLQTSHERAPSQEACSWLRNSFSHMLLGQYAPGAEKDLLDSVGM